MLKIGPPYLEQEWEVTGNVVTLLYLWHLQDRFDEGRFVLLSFDRNLDERADRVPDGTGINQRDIRADVAPSSQFLQTLVNR
jgi:hypothetical protein